MKPLTANRRYCSEISKTQLEKSIVNANKELRNVLFPLVNFTLLAPGDKVLIPCRIERDEEIFQTVASCYIPIRRGDTRPEPRIWPKKAAHFLKAGDVLEWQIFKEVIHITVLK